jgi:hypothetical protein
MGEKTPGDAHPIPDSFHPFSPEECAAARHLLYIRLEGQLQSFVTIRLRSVIATIAVAFISFLADKTTVKPG